MPVIRRPQYLDRLKAMAGTPDIKVITGVRRSGKSMVMRMLSDGLHEGDPSCNSVYIDLLDLDNTPQWLLGKQGF